MSIRGLNEFKKARHIIKYADVAELADALGSGPSESNFMWVQVPSSAPKINAEWDTFCVYFLSIAKLMIYKACALILAIICDIITIK